MTLGYREASLAADGALGPAGATLRGHEFHYATIVAQGGDEPFAHVRDAYGAPARAGGIAPRQGQRLVFPCDRGGVSDCLSGQAIFHGDLVRTIALRIVRSWRRQAMMATFFGLPRLTRRW